MATVVELPRLTDTMEEGVIAKWRIKVGDKVRRGQVIAEIETDKATMEFESFDAGTVLKLIAEEGETLALGAPIAVFGKEGEDADAAVAGRGGKPAAKSADSGGEAAGDAKADDAEADDAGADEAEADDDEAEADDEADDESEAAKAKSADDKSADKKSAGDAKAKSADDKAKSAEAKPKSAEPAESADRGRIPASPLARRLARENDLELASIPGSGPHGRVVKADVLAAAEAAKAAPAAAGACPAATPSAETDGLGRPFASFPDRPVKLTQMRKAIAKRMTQSKRDIPHINLTIPIVMDRVHSLRAELNEAVEGAKISYNDFVILAAARALREHPRVNGAYAPEGLTEYGDVHVGVAVAIEGGLVVPVIRFADQKSISQISREMRDLGARARDKALKPDEMSGSTFTVSNLGMFGIEHFTAVINPGEGAILAVGALADEVVAVDGQMVIRKIMRCTLCSDHRLFDGADNARFLATLKRLLERPMSLFA